MRFKYERQQSPLPGYESVRNVGGICTYVRIKSEDQLLTSDQAQFERFSYILSNGYR